MKRLMILIAIALLFVLSQPDEKGEPPKEYFKNLSVKTEMPVRVNIKFRPGTPQYLKETYFARHELKIIEYDVFGYDITETFAMPDSLQEEFFYLLSTENPGQTKIRIEKYEIEKPRKINFNGGCLTELRNNLVNSFYYSWYENFIGVEAAHKFIKEKNIPLQGNGIIIVDGGPDFDHRDIKPALKYIDGAPVYWFSKRKLLNQTLTHHANHVSCLAAGYRNGRGVDGVAAPKSYILPLIIGYDGYLASDMARGLKYFKNLEKNGKIIFKVVNMSFQLGTDSEILRSAITEMNDKLFVAAAGNAPKNIDEVKEYPASWRFKNLIAVAATDKNDRLAARFSNYGEDTVQIAAPGVGIVSCTGLGEYGIMGGTSMATSLVSGTASLLWSMNPNLTIRQIKNILLTSCDSIYDLKGKVKNACRLSVIGAVQYLYELSD